MRNHGLFVGYAPTNAPKYAVCVGFCVPLNIKTYLLGATIHLTDEQLNEIQKVPGDEHV